MAWTIEVDFGAGYDDITIYCSGLTKRQKLHNNLRPTVNTCSFIVDDITTANKFNAAVVDMKLKIQKDAADWFIGLIRPTFENTIKYTNNQMVIEGYDKSILLQQKINPDPAFYWRSYYVCRTSNKATSIVHQLLYKAGIVDGEIDFPDIGTQTILFYGVEASQKKTYLKEISDLLYEFGWVLDVKNDGMFELHDLYPTALGGLTPIDDTDLYNTFKITKKEVKYEAVRVNWYPTVIINGVKVVSEVNTERSHVLKKGAWYPSSVLDESIFKFAILEQPQVSSTGLTPEEGIYAYLASLVELDVSGWELLGTFNAKLTYKLVRVYERTYDYIEGAKEAVIRFQASIQGWVSHRIAWFKVIADAVIRKKDERFSPISPAGYAAGGGQKILDIPTKFIGDEVNAQRLANGMRKYLGFADFEYRGNTLGSYSLSEHLNFTEGVTGIASKLRVVEIQEEAQYGRKQILCEGIDDITIVAVDVTKIKLPRIPLVPIEDKIEDYGETLDALVGLDGETFKNDDSIDPEFHLFELSEPDCQNNYGLEPVDKVVHFEPAEVEDERRFRYRNPHMKMFEGLSEAIFAERKNLVKDSEDLTTVNWANTNSKDALTNLHVNSLCFTKIITTAAWGLVYQTFNITANKHGLQCIVKKGDGTVARFRFSDVGNKGDVTITWATQAIVAANGATHLEYLWIDDETVWVSFLSATCAAGIGTVYAFADESDAKHSYWTAVQLEDNAYPSPYIPLYRYPTQVRLEVNAEHRATMQSKFVFKVKVKPWFTYDTVTWHAIFSWYIDATHRLIIYYNNSSDIFQIYWQDGGAARYLDSEQFDDGSAHDDINSEIILCGIIDLATGGVATGSRFFAIVDGVKQVEDILWSNNIDVLASSFTTLEIGHANKANHADSLIEYIKIWDWDGVALGAIANEIEFDVAVGGLTERFSHILEEYDGKYQLLSKRGAIGVFQPIENVTTSPEDLTNAAGWISVRATVTLSDLYIDGKRFSKIQGDGTGDYGRTYRNVTLTGDGGKSVHCIFKKGNNIKTRMFLYDLTADTIRFQAELVWATKVVTAVVGTVFEVNWYSDDTVEILGISTACIAANTNQIFVYGPYDAGGNTTTYGYATAVMVEDNSYPTPYTPTIRETNLLKYQYRMPPVFTIMFWIRPWFAYDTGDNKHLLEWILDGSHQFAFYYKASGDTIRVFWYSAGTPRELISQQFDDGSVHDDINQWIHVAAKINLTTGAATGSELWINGILRNDNWGGAIDGYSNDYPALTIGDYALGLGGNYVSDSLFSDLLIVPYLVGDSIIKDHYLKNRPWYEPAEIANVERTVKVGPGGIRMHNSALTLTDRFRRQIDISNQAGLLARDAAGKVIHDIPDALILKDMIYGGHNLWRESPDYIDSYILNYTDTQIARGVTSPTQNIDLTSYLPPECPTPKGCFSLSIWIAGWILLSVRTQPTRRVSQDSLPSTIRLRELGTL